MQATCVAVAWLAAGLAWAGPSEQARPPAGPAEEQLAGFILRLYRDVASGDVAARRATYKTVLPGREEFDAVFGTNAPALWPHYEQRLTRFLVRAPQMKGRTRKLSHIDNIIDEIRLVALSRHAEYTEFLSLIPAGMPAYKAVTHPGPPGEVAVSGPYLFVRGRWLWMQGADRLPEALRRLRHDADGDLDAGESAGTPPRGGSERDDARLP